MNTEAALRTAAEKLDQAGIAEPRREAASLLAFILKTDRAFLIAHPEHELTADRSILYKSVVKRRANREPFQHIVGRQEFYGLDFLVTPDVLVPRPETELLVEIALQKLAQVDDVRFLEIGVGSGCISVSILHHLPEATSLAVDLSRPALGIALRNAESLGVASRLQLLESNVYESVPEENFSAILSNPPYIPAADIGNLQPEVRDFDPHIALTDGGDGLAIIRTIIDGAAARLRAGGLLLIEIGQGQAADVRDLLSGGPWTDVDFAPDLQGNPRVAVARIG